MRRSKKGTKRAWKSNERSKLYVRIHVQHGIEELNLHVIPSHPNFGWGGNQNPKNNHFQNHPPYQPFHPPPFPQPITLPPPPQPKPPHINFEAALEKLTLTNLEFVQKTNNFIDETRANFRNQGASIKNLQTQVGQIAMQLSTTFPNAFPSNTMVIPTVECYAITIRNGEALQDNKQEEAMQEFQAKQGRYDVLDDTNQDFVMQELDAIV
ncbi:hypothetical protein PIB30_084281 [Stylosanthes scabra]|uniref:Uncharacterized protein n=1 Tax=Stylosanthes scabra TaxID=79078 RepID=A0ABU6RT38_9FABA|nr:hypothetical protein [Stylosanthes scabra]